VCAKKRSPDEVSLAAGAWSGAVLPIYFGDFCPVFVRQDAVANTAIYTLSCALG
jgi:hypothetical protein